MTKAKPLGIAQGSPYSGTISKNGKTFTGNTPAWGGGNTGGGGGVNSPGVNMTISMRRGDLQTAPEGIAFFANVSGFDAQPPAHLPGAWPASGDAYDETMHDITYVWNFGDPTAPTNAYQRMLPTWQDNNIGYGPFPCHVFANPGTYTITCAAYERSSGKQAFASYEVTVADPNVTFPEAYTICIAPDGDFTGAPTTVPANRVTTLVDAENRYGAIRWDGQPIRILLKSGQVHQATKDIGWAGAGKAVHINTWGGTALAIVERLTGPRQGTFIFFNNGSSFGSTIANIEYRGGWNAADPISSTTYTPASAFGFSSGHNTAYNCHAKGVNSGFSSGFYSNDVSIFANCSVDGWKNVGWWGEGFSNQLNQSTVVNNYVGIVGCRATQDINATINGVDDNGNVGVVQNALGPMRNGSIGYLHIDGFETYSRTGWSERSDGTLAEQGIRDGRNDPRSKGLISRLYGEGGWGVYSTDNGAYNVYHPCNTVLDKFYFLSSANATGSMALRMSCTTVRNGILHEPNVKNDIGANPYNHGINLGFLGNMQTAENRLYPINIYNVSFINEQNQANNPAAWVPILTTDGDWNEGQIQAVNNVVHRPNFPGGFTGDAPLDTTRLGIDARNLGWKWYAHGSIPAKLPMDTSYATPANPLSYWRPTTGSPAIASATGALVAYDDMLGNVRPASASRGAVEPA